MKGNYTFSMIKPHAVRSEKIGEILTMIQKGGFHIGAMKLTQLSLERAREFYAVHRERPFYDELCQNMIAGPVVALMLEKDEAVKSFRDFIGATNPSEADAGTIRALFGNSIDENAVHGSDSDENATIETDFFFSPEERFPA